MEILFPDFYIVWDKLSERKDAMAIPPCYALFFDQGN